MTKPSRSQPDPLAREVNRLLAQLEHGAPIPQPADVRPNGATPPRPVSSPKVTRVSGPTRSIRTDLLALWSRVLLGTALGAVMTQWPYSRACGLPLGGYLAAVFMVMLAAAWIGFGSWRLRSGFPHIVGLILFFWGTVLAAEQLLPRMGYAAERAVWLCPDESTQPRAVPDAGNTALR